MPKRNEIEKHQQKSAKAMKRDTAIDSDSFDDVLKTFRILREKQPLYRGDIVAEIRADRTERYRHF